MKNKVIYVNFKSKVILKDTNYIIVLFKLIKHKISNLFKRNQCYNSKILDFKSNKIS